MSVLIKHMAMPKGCIYANDKDQTEYCPLLNHDEVPFCQYIENEPEIAIGIDERPVYCPLSDVPEPCQDTVSRQAAIDLLKQMRKDGDMVPWEGKDVFARIRKLPSAQPQRKTGEWLPDCEYDGEDEWCFYTCSCCEYQSDDQFKYCPNCGARMVQEGEDNAEE